MKQIFGDEVRSIQLEILDEVHRFCGQNNINYTLAYGTLIGAIRHKGYIPWDDDIDIAMPYPDFKRFLELFNQNNSKYGVIDVELNKKFPYICAKVFKKNTLLLEPNNYELGINIDLFPIYGMPQKQSEQIKHFNKIKRLHHKFLIIKNIDLAKKRVWYKSFAIRVLRVLTAGLSFYNYRKLIKKYPYQNCAYAKITSFEMKTLAVFPKECFEERVLADFEGRQYYIPAQYDKILREIYGDYMTPPPAEKQKSHHVYQAFVTED